MSSVSSKRPLVAEISHQAFRHNLAKARQLTPNARVMAILKADGYGHGLNNLLPASHQADGFGVLKLDAALKIKKNFPDKPVILLEGFFDVTELVEIREFGITPVIHSEWQVDVLESSKIVPRSVYLKINTGMNRLGFPVSAAKTIYGRLSAIPGIENIGLMSHLANADDPSDSFTEAQLASFKKSVSNLLAECSLANSAGVCGWPETHLDWVRPGIMLYGSSPLINNSADSLGLQAVMTLKSRVIAIQNLHAGDRVGYGGIGVCEETCRVAIIACGYGDGYPRHARQGTPVLINGNRYPLIGRVSMDMLAINLGSDSPASIGDTAILWGRGLPADEIAQCAGTIAYELFTGVTARVPRQVVD